MKKIKYPGSLTRDLDLLNDKTEENFSSNLFPTVIKTFIVIILLIVIISTLLGSFPSTLIVSLSTCISSYALTRSISAKNFFEKERQKMSARMRISNLSFDFIKKEDTEKANESIYTDDDIISAVVLSSSPDESLENEFTSEDIDAYIQEIVNDIYFVNKHSKIKILREVKKFIVFGEDLKTEKTSELFELEENEYPKVSEMPVKQVLRLSGDNK